jgi:hypothetical protein
MSPSWATATLSAACLPSASATIELDPKYVDVVIQRWLQLTGKDAKLDGDGRTFAEIKAERMGAAA